MKEPIRLSKFNENSTYLRSIKNKILLRTDWCRVDDFRGGEDFRSKQNIGRALKCDVSKLIMLLDLFPNLKNS